MNNRDEDFTRNLAYSKKKPVVHIARAWPDELIKNGIDKFIEEYGKMPTARDFDTVEYLPSARQVQRNHGGLATIREKFGYTDLDFTKGSLRKEIAIAANKRGVTAEDLLEELLVNHFGEPFVHVQKRYYKGSKNRYDFLIYAKNRVFGIDIFTTDRDAYIGTNIRHKIKRYKDIPKELDVYFILSGSTISQNELDKISGSISDLSIYRNMKVVLEESFLIMIQTFEPLEVPPDFLTIGSYYSSID